MGSIAASGGNAYRALTQPPTPGVSIHENWLFDDATIAAGNEGDGRVDDGETIHLGIELINRSGYAENVTATLTAQAPGAVVPDPYGTFVTDAVDYGNIGPFALSDNGLEWNGASEIKPFVFQVDPGCPNDHVIPLVLTVSFEDGWDPGHAGYTRVSRFDYVVQRGRNLPSVIDEDMTLKSEDFWIVGGPVLIEPGVTVTVEPGTQIQWGSVSDDPYNPGPQSGYIIVRGTLEVQGTSDEPVGMFPSYLVSGQMVRMWVEGGLANLFYVAVRNPLISGFDTIDHG
jgi:hypothetical protein